MIGWKWLITLLFSNIRKEADMSFAQQLLDGEKEIRALITTHPFVQGLADGTLPVERFRFYMAQDYVFLVEYGRIWGLAVAKARDRPTDEETGATTPLHPGGGDGSPP